MYKFQLATPSGEIEASIFFSHKGGKKGSATVPGPPPKMTKCTIVANGKLLGEGYSAPVEELAELLPKGVPASAAQAVYGRRLIRTVKDTGSGRTIALLKGDSFSRRKGRKAALAKALKSLDRNDRPPAWRAIGEMPA